MAAQSISAQRMVAADTRGFTQPGAGAIRRAAIVRLTTDWLGYVFDQATDGMAGGGMALAAVGSLGRGDTGPLSDLDLVLLHDDRLPSGKLAEIADQIWYPIWDQGLSLDHSVRTLAECRQVALSDLPATVGLLDVCLVAGDPMVVAAARSTLARDWRSAARRRLPDLLDAVGQRHERHGELAHLLEPDLKEARGGLRDMSVLRALTTAWLADRPHGLVDLAYQQLLDLRDAVHVVTGRGRSRLLQQDQDAVAALLGMSDSDALLRRAAEAARVIAAAVDSTTRRASQSQRARSLRVGARRPTLRPIGYGLHAHDGEAVLGPRVDPQASPLTTLRAAAVAAKAGLPLSPATVDNLARNTPPLPIPWPPAARDLLGDLLASGEGLIAVWESLTLAGVVETWLPHWASVRSHPQRNPIHRHTVDRHQVQAVVEAVDLLPGVHRPDLLLFACLIHDMGKAVPDAADHSAAGAPLAAQMARRVGFPEEDVAVLRCLVAEHLTLVELATRRDPRDPQTVQLLLDAIGGSAELLDLLRALTEADARGVGAGAWNPWRVRLIDDLTEAARRYLNRSGSGGHPAGAEPASVPGVADTTVDPRLLATLERDGVAVAVTPDQDGQLVVVSMPDRLGLFADMAGLLAVSGMTVRRAEAQTVDGVATDRWYVDSASGHRVEAESLRRALRRISAGERALFDALKGTASRPGPTAPVTRALILPEASAEATVLELRAHDRPGLLHDVGRCLAALGVSILSAHVATYAGQAVDTVYLTEADGSRLAPARVAAAIGALIDVSDLTPSATSADIG